MPASRKAFSGTTSFAFGQSRRSGRGARASGSRGPLDMMLRIVSRLSSAFRSHLAP